MSAQPRELTLDHLMEKAGIQGYLTSEDLAAAFPDPAHDKGEIRALVILLRRRGVDVVETDQEASSVTPFEEDTPLSELDPHSNEQPADDDPIGFYLKEMSRVPLLSMEDELKIAIRIEKGNHASTKLPTLSGHGTAAARCRLEAIVQDGVMAREHLIKANTRLVVSIAKRYVGRGVPFLDLIQEGNLGLMKAVGKYDHHRGFRFSTYATWWIRQSISRALINQSRTIRVPVHMVDRIQKLYKSTRDLEQKLGRPPSMEELARDVKLSVEKVKWIYKVSLHPLSLEAPVGGDEGSELGMLIQDDLTPDPHQSAYEAMLKDKLEEVLASLPPREAHVLRLRFGLDDGNIYTLEEVGRKFGLTRERIRQLEGKALGQLRHPHQSGKLKDYL